MGADVGASAGAGAGAGAIPGVGANVIANAEGNAEYGFFVKLPPRRKKKKTGGASSALDGDVLPSAVGVAGVAGVNARNQHALATVVVKNLDTGEYVVVCVSAKRFCAHSVVLDQ
jgi:hypothetical protein